MIDFIIISLQNIKHFFLDYWASIVGLFMSMLGYFLPIRDLVHLVIFFFIIEMITGYYAAKSKANLKRKKLNFSLTIVYTKTIPRMFITILILIMAYLWDTVNNQKWVPTYTILGWFFTGILLLKTMRHSYTVTKWIGFKYAEILIVNKMKNNIDEFENPPK